MSGKTKVKRMGNRVFVIGLDGATFDIIEPLVKGGKLPTFKNLMEEGVWGKLGSTMPPVTAPAWVSFMTGKNPGKHGVFGFVGPLMENYRRKILNYKSIRCHTLWQILTKYNKKVGIINLPFTYPPEHVKGFVIPEVVGQIWNDEPLSYPQELADMLRKHIKNYFSSPDCLKYWFTDQKDNLLTELYRALDSKKKATHYLMKQYEWDILVSVFTETDRVQHFFWKYMDSKHPAYDAATAKRYGDAIFNFYQAMDRAIGELIEKLGDSANLMIVSDHGFGPNHKSVYINRWLVNLGLLKLRRITYPLRKFKFPNVTYKILFKLGIPYINPIVFKKVEGSKQEIDPRLGLNIYSLIDWSRTKAYCGHRSEQGIFINLRGREPKGIISPGREYEELRDQIIDELYKIKDPVDNKTVVDRAYRREEIYHGGSIHQAPDILFEMRDYIYKAVEPIHEEKIVEEERWLTGSHRLNGIFLIKGPVIKNGSKIDGAEIVDIVPTILHLMGLPIPKDIDGRVLTECLVPKYLESHPVQYSAVIPEKDQDISDDIYTLDQERAITEKLKSLGYID